LGYRALVFLWAVVRTTLKPDEVPGAAMGHGTKSLRDRPLRGALRRVQ
jgi:hypothetical protein